MHIFCPDPVSSIPLHPLFNFRFTPDHKIEGLFKSNLPPNFFAEKVDYVATPEDADVIVLPNNFLMHGQKAREYITRFADVGEKHHKPVFVFSCGDHTDSLVFDPRVWVFRYSLYKSSMTPRDISMPTLTEDLGALGITLRVKQETPTVSFCGKADFSSSRELYAGIIKKVGWELRALFNRKLRARIRGVFWRVWSIRALKRSNLVKTFFIIRKTFSGAEKTIELDPSVARKEFIESLVNTDFVLAPKGDGNYSNRFLEALSKGRFPVVPDTDCVFSFEDEVQYEKIVVRVPMNEIKKMPQFVREFYDSLSAEEFTVRQKLAREIFERYLRQDAFLTHLFTQRLADFQTQK